VSVQVERSSIAVDAPLTTTKFTTKYA